MSKWIKVKVDDDFEIDETAKVSLSQGDELIPVDEIWTPKYHNVLDHGFVGLQDFMGSDEAVVNAARTSYGGGTKKKRSDEGLIRYLMNHRHTTPFEMLEFVFHVKAPIFVFRQWHRHRTASINEMSARYSVLDNEMYIPEYEDTAEQAKDNKQGRSGLLSETNYNAVYAAIKEAHQLSYDTYCYILNDEDNKVIPEPILNRKLWIEDACMKSIIQAQNQNPEVEWTEEMIEEKIREWYLANELAIADKDFAGIARELARNVLPVSTYSQMYWKVNGKNFLHFISLRYDSHAQKEIRVYAEKMLDLVKPLCPWVIKAFMDYQFEGTTLSKFELKLLKDMGKYLSNYIGPEKMEEWVQQNLNENGATDREVTEFMKKVSL